MAGRHEHQPLECNEYVVAPAAPPLISGASQSKARRALGDCCRCPEGIKSITQDEALRKVIFENLGALKRCNQIGGPIQQDLLTTIRIVMGFGREVWTLRYG